MPLEQFNAPEWASIALPLAALVVAGTVLARLIIGWRKNRDRDQDR